MEFLKITFQSKWPLSYWLTFSCPYHLGLKGPSGKGVLIQFVHVHKKYMHQLLSTTTIGLTEKSAYERQPYLTPAIVMSEHGIL